MSSAKGPVQRFSGKRALVVGAGGICSAAARLLAKEGASLVVVDHMEAPLNALRDSLMPEVQCETIVIDAMSEDQVGRCVASIAGAGRVDILVNGIGGSTINGKFSADLEQFSLADWNAMFQFNLTPMFLFCRDVIPHMKQARSGKIVNISSLSARGETVTSAAYGASKAAIESFTRRVSREVAPFGVYCNAIAPGLTFTDRIRTHFENLGEQVLREMLSTVPLGRFATPQDQAEVIAFLASYQSDFVTGVTIDVTGGE